MNGHTRNHGFTLIELIAIIVLVGIAASFLVTLQTRIANAPDVVLVSQQEATAERAMERIMADYLVLINGSAPDGALAQMVTNNNNGDYTALGANVTMQYITFDGTGGEVASASATPTLKVTVTVTTDNQNRKITLLTSARTTAGETAGTDEYNNY